MVAVSREVRAALNMIDILYAEMNGRDTFDSATTFILPPAFFLAVEHSPTFNKRKRATGDWYPAYVEARLGKVLKILKEKLIEIGSRPYWWIQENTDLDISENLYSMIRWFAENSWMIQIKYDERNPDKSWYVSIHRELVEWAKDVIYALYQEGKERLIMKAFIFWMIYKAKIGKVRDKEKDYLNSYSALVYLTLNEDPQLKELISILKNAVFKVKIAWRTIVNSVPYKIPSSWYRYLMYRPEPPRVRRKKAFAASLYWPGAMLSVFAFKKMFRWMGVFYYFVRMYYENSRYYGEKLALFYPYPSENRRAMIEHSNIYQFTHEMWEAFATLFGWGYGYFPLGGYARSRYPVSPARYFKSEFGPMKHLMAGVSSNLGDVMEQFVKKGRWPLNAVVREHRTVLPSPVGMSIAIDMFTGKYLYDRVIGGDWKKLRKLGFTILEINKHEVVNFLKCIRKLQYGISFDCLVDAVLNLAERKTQLMGFIMAPFILDYPVGGTPVNIFEGTIPTEVALKFIEMVKKAAERDGSIEILEKLVKRARKLRSRLDKYIEEGKQTAGAMSNGFYGGWKDVIEFNIVGADKGTYWKYIPGKDGSRVDSEEGRREMIEKWTEIMDWFYAILVYMKMKAMSRLGKEERKHIYELMRKTGIITNTGVWSSPYTAAPKGTFRYSKAKYEWTREWNETFVEAARRGVLDDINWFFRHVEYWFD